MNLEEEATQVRARGWAAAITIAILLTAITPAALAAAPPTISSFSPTSGPVGTTVTINGNNFNGVTSVTFGTQTTTAVTIVSNHQVRVNVPSGATTGTVKVTSPDGTATSTTNFTVTAAAPPTITSFTPTSGATGTAVTINGTNFTASSVVKFNGQTATAVTFNSATKLTANVPAGASTGHISVTTVIGTATSTGTFTITPTPAPPTISSFTPTTGGVGTVVTITGTNFVSPITVLFNGQTGTATTILSSTQVRSTVPTGATTGKISVTTLGGTATSTANFTVIPAPTITSFTPTSGPTGTSVTITGTNFTGSVAVFFNNTPTTVTVNSTTSLTAIVPTAATTGPIKVTASGGSVTSSTNFTVTNVAPTITSFAPTAGPTGTVVTISGTHFTSSTTVRFNGQTTTATVTSPQTLTATVPTAATTGPITVTNAGGTATSATNFTVRPAISSFTPTSGPTGTVVTITGSGLNGATSVTFNGAGAAFTVNSSTQISATVPANATTGTIAVVTPGGTATSSGTYTVTVVTPSISSFTPASGPVGTVVTITGSNFSGATTVTFNGMSAAFTINSSTQITATVPANASTGPVRVTTPSGTATSASNFVVTVTKHRRAVSLHVGRHLRAHGQVSVQFGFSSCADNVPVKIQKRRPGSWHTETRVLTNALGAYRVRLFGHGTYRAVASRLSIGSDVCRQAASGRVTISRRF